ncbi:MAG TPA: porin [Thermoanaerobaculia bacterium]|nr:porin [Thermoanaerobaculia bacterium]
MHQFNRISCCLALVALAGLPAFAQSTGSTIDIHGFGGWAYGKTDGHKYSLGTEGGEYDNAEFALNVSAKPIEKLSVVAQMRLESGSDQEQAELDYAFAEWAFSDAVRVRVGRVKHPFGIYGEVFDVGTVRPFYSLPQSLYGANGFTARAYNGAGITGNVPVGKWNLQYDVYGGQIEGDFETPGLLSTSSKYFAEPSITFGYRVEDAYGGRLNVTTPLEGLTVGVSGYTGQAYTDLSNVDVDKRDVYAAQAEYVRNKFAIRSEFGHLKNGGDFNVDSGYVETSYRLTDHWQVAARWDQVDVTLPGVNLSRLPKIFPQLLDHREAALGVSYWFGPNFVVRGSYQRTEGNRFAFPETTQQVQAALSSGVLDNSTDMILVGAQFSF